MTSSPSSYLRLLSVVTRWINTPEPGDELRSLAQLFITLLGAVDQETRAALKSDLSSISERELYHELNEIAQQRGAQVAHAAQEITRRWRELLEESSEDSSEESSEVSSEETDLDELISRLNASFSERESRLLEPPQLTDAQRGIGSFIVDVSLGRRGPKALERIAWISHQERHGPAALSILGVPLTPCERIELTLLVLDGLAEMHHGRLERTEGFAPERMIIMSDLTVYVPASERTRVKELMSPEQQIPGHIAREKLDKHSDVWTVARLFSSIYRAEGLARGLKTPLELPPEVDQALKRSLERNPEARFHSGRELRVILEKPLLGWRERTQHEAGQEVGLIEPSLTFDELLEQREEEQERRVERRRARELKTRRRRRWRAYLKQIVWTAIIIGLIGGGAWWWRQHQLERLNEALERREALAERDIAFNQLDVDAQVEPEARVMWRQVTVDAEGHRALVSVSHITASQYARCVSAGQCTALQHDEGCVSDRSRQPRNCVTLEQAERFARFVGGELLTVDDWRAITFGPELTRKYPWGSDTFNSTRAALKWSNLARDQRAEPFEVCSQPLGDSPDALCDLIGNVYEWVILPRERQRASSGESKTSTKGQASNEREADEPPPIIGVVGASWQTRPHTFKPQQFSVRRATKPDPLIGFRVIKRGAP